MSCMFGVCQITFINMDLEVLQAFPIVSRSTHASQIAYFPLARCRSAGNRCKTNVAKKSLQNSATLISPVSRQQKGHAYVIIHNGFENMLRTSTDMYMYIYIGMFFAYLHSSTSTFACGTFFFQVDILKFPVAWLCTWRSQENKTWGHRGQWLQRK